MSTEASQLMKGGGKANDNGDYTVAHTKTTGSENSKRESRNIYYILGLVALAIIAVGWALQPAEFSLRDLFNKKLIQL